MEEQLFNIRPQRPGYVALHHVRSFIGLFHHRAACVSYPIGVVAIAAHQGVGPESTIEHVHRTVARENVVQAVAGAVERPDSGEGQVFDIGPQHPGNLADHQVCSLIGLFHHGVADAHFIDVVAYAADEDICPGPTIEPIVPTVARECVIQAVAGPIDRPSPREGQVLHIRSEGISHGTLDGVRPVVHLLGYHIVHLVHEIGVVPGSPHQGVGPESTIEHVRRAVARENVVQAVAGAVEQPDSDEGQVLDIGAQRECCIAEHLVQALIDRFHDRIARVDQVDVVAESTNQGVGAEFTIQGVVASAAGEAVRCIVARKRVVQAVAGPVDGPHTRKREVLDIGLQGPGYVALDPVHTFTDVFHHRIADAHPIDVVARAPGQHIRRAVKAAFENVVQAVAGAVDGVCPDEGQVLNVGAQRPGYVALDPVHTFTDVFHHRIADARIIGIVAGAACQDVVAEPPIEIIIAEASHETIIAVEPKEGVVAPTYKPRIVADNRIV